MNKDILKAQKSEITEHYIYQKLGQIEKNIDNKRILNHISLDELRHYKIWKSITKIDIKPNKLRIFYYVFLAKIFGLSFSLKLMEGGETNAQNFYEKISKKYPIAKEIEKDELDHERKLIRILNDERLTYAGAIVLGLNDALVELTGTLAGLTLAFQNSKLIGITGIIIGIAASLSMTASGYLSSREEEKEEINPIKSAIYTGIAYILTVALLVVPYFIFENIFYSLFTMILISILIILTYTFYISVAKEVSFRRKFFEMAFISLGVTLISFIIGYFVKVYFGIEI